LLRWQSVTGVVFTLSNLAWGPIVLVLTGPHAWRTDPPLMAVAFYVAAALVVPERPGHRLGLRDWHCAMARRPSSGPVIWKNPDSRGLSRGTVPWVLSGCRLTTACPQHQQRQTGPTFAHVSRTALTGYEETPDDSGA
jgi:hypothetical protein